MSETETLIQSLYQTEEYQALMQTIGDAVSRTDFLRSVEDLLLQGMKRVDRLRVSGLEKKRTVLEAVFGILDSWVHMIETSPVLNPVRELLPDIASTWIDTVVAVRKGDMDYKTGAWSLLKSCCPTK